jgi:hypothetical protein
MRLDRIRHEGTLGERMYPFVDSLWAGGRARPTDGQCGSDTGLGRTRGPQISCSPPYGSPRRVERAVPSSCHTRVTRGLAHLSAPLRERDEPIASRLDARIRGTWAGITPGEPATRKRGSSPSQLHRVSPQSPTLVPMDDMTAIRRPPPDAPEGRPLHWCPNVSCPVLHRGWHCGGERSHEVRSTARQLRRYQWK